MPLSVLNINDDEATRFIRTRIFRSAGYTVWEGETVADCLRLTREKLPSLVLLDVRLPDGNGFAACRELKRDPATSRVPVILISQIARADHRLAESGECDAEAYLQEPVEPDALLAVAATHTRDDQPPEPLRGAAPPPHKASPYAGLFGTFEWSPQSGGVIVSPEILALAGREPHAARVPTDSWRDCVHPDDRDALESSFNDSVAARRPGFQHDFRTPAGEGGPRWIHCRTNLRYGQDGALNSVAGVLIDISDRKRMEEGLEQSNRELAQFASIVAHDLHAPLNVISTYCRWLGEQYAGRFDESADRYLQSIHTAVRRMKSFLHGLLEYSRADGVMLRPRIELDCNEAMGRVLVTLDAAVRDSGAVVTWSSLPMVLVPEGQMEQILQNLIGNAIKFRDPSRQPTIHVTTVQDAREWIFRVEDNGIGIAAEDCERIFRPLERGHRIVDSEGAGIGLAICKRIVERLGGRIWVDSEPGRGSMFFFALPR